MPPEDAVESLFSHERAITTALTPIVTYNEKNGLQAYDNCFIARETDTNGKVLKTHIAERRSGLKEVFRCGASCILNAREVIEKIDRPSSSSSRTRTTRSTCAPRVAELSFSMSILLKMKRSNYYLKRPRFSGSPTASAGTSVINPISTRIYGRADPQAPATKQAEKRADAKGQ